jgi:hypothetical protein
MVALALAGPRGPEGGEDRPLEGDPVLGGADDATATDQAVDGHGSPGTRDDLECSAPEPVADGNSGPDQAGRHGVAGALEGDRRVGIDSPVRASVAGYGRTGSAMSGSAAASAPMVVLALRRTSATLAQKRSRLAWASATVCASSVRHQRPQAFRTAASTDPLRLPRRGGQGRMTTP